MFVIGTAGHIDHGKSSLIRQLTGIDPDRLPEEKARGMTIDIGFAHYDTPDGKRIGIIDVPGHERFVRNMIAGAGGIDAVILVIAADDGWMPQSREHLQICHLLGVQHGFIVLTKIDLVEKNWLELVEEDLHDRVKGTFLKGQPIVRISSVTGEGFDSVREEIGRLSEVVISREDIGKPRLYIDRSFVLAGMGGVVAGTLKGGTLKVAQDVVVFPSGKKGRVRTIQSHGQQTEIAFPGQRTSISLTGIDKQYLKRGGVVTIPELIKDIVDNQVLALSVSVLAESPVVLDNRRKLLMILGTTEVEGEMRLFGSEPIRPGGEGIIFFRPYEPLFSFIGDRFILRLPTPQVTVGGGELLDVIGNFPRRKELPQFEYLHKRKKKTVETLVTTELDKMSFISADVNFRRCNFAREAIDNVIKSMKEQSLLDEYNGLWYRPEELKPRFDKIRKGIADFLAEYPHLDGAPIDVVARESDQPLGNIEMILELMRQKKLLIKKGNRFDLPDREVTVRGEIKTSAENIAKKLLAADLTPPLLKELLGDDKVSREAFDYLLRSGQAIKIGANLAYHAEVWKKIVETIRGMLNKNETLSVATLREKLNITRKFTLPILEEADRLKITRREGDVRIKGDNYEKI